MATKLVVCPDCEAPVSPGRFSCSECGALLASVAGQPAPMSATAVDEPAEADVEAPIVSSAPEVASPDPTAPEAAAPEPVAPEPVAPDAAAPVAPDAVAPAPKAAATTAQPAERTRPATPAKSTTKRPAKTVVPPGELPPVLQEWVGPAPEDYQPEPTVAQAEVAPALATPEAAALEIAPPVALAPDPSPVLASDPAPAPMPAAREVSWPVPAAEQVSTLEPEPPATPRWPPVGAADEVRWPEPSEQANRTPAGAWVPPASPPSAAPAAPPPATLTPSATLPHGGARPMAAMPGVVNVVPASSLDAGTPEGKVSSGPRPWFALPTDVPSWIILIGAAVTLSSFFLPWSDVMIGATGVGDYGDKWGFVGPLHPLMALLCIVVAVLVLMRERLPAAVSPAMPAVIVGGIVVGMAWPYMFGPLGALLGAMVAVVGAILLVTGGGLEVQAIRHAGDD